MSTMGIWIMVATVLFVLGNIMALKPGGVEQRLDKLRMSARKLKLNPKLIACPSWIRGRDNEYGRGMIAQYALIMPDKKLPELYYQIIDDRLRPLSLESMAKLTSELPYTYQPNSTVLYRLDTMPLDLPDSITQNVKAVYTKANSIVMFWDDTGYVRPNSNPNYDPADIDADLIVLKERLQSWADTLQPPVD